ncbi:MAG: hypothetical protein HOP33_22045 [Verrucomicrobia bacterium]|nr:hypothetical protein [Verrucomicrobiota bacterium]
MKTDDFENRLQRQSPRQIPSAWRNNILSDAQSASQTPPTAVPTAPSRNGIVIILWRELVWPCRRTWAGLAATWLVLTVFNFMHADHTEVVARNTPPPSPEVLMVLKQQYLLLAELTERNQLRAADRPKTVPPRPRSQRQWEMWTV